KSGGGKSGEGVEPRLGVPEIGGIEALGEPGGNGREQLARFGPPPLLTPQSSKARRGAQLIGSCLLPARNAERLFEGALGLVKPLEAEERDAFEAVKLRLPQKLTRFLLRLHSLPHRGDGRPVLTLLP